MNYQFPIQIQFDHQDAEDSIACMCHVFDLASFHKLTAQLPKIYAHVVAYDSFGKVIFTEDKR